jgi:hypothetical protein
MGGGSRDTSREPHRSAPGLASMADGGCGAQGGHARLPLLLGHGPWFTMVIGRCVLGRAALAGPPR